jgi:hypothetical protein
MKEARKNQIAYLFLLDKILREGIHLGPEIPKQIARTARMIGIGYDEAREFAEIVIRALVDDVFAKGRKYDPGHSRAPSIGDLAPSGSIGHSLKQIQEMIGRAQKRMKAKKRTKK